VERGPASSQAECGTSFLTYPPNPEVDRSSKTCFIAGFPSGFPCEIRREDSRARFTELFDEQGEPKGRVSLLRPPSSYTHRT
jgi:hypothetical protein